MKNRFAFFFGPLLFVIIGLADVFGLGNDQASVLGIVAWMLTWWISETVAMAVTSLLPVVLLPLTGVLSLEEATAPYGDKYVFLFLGGFILALAMEKWHLHRRLALNIILRTGTGANRIVFGFMAASFLISMWISNTATALMMFPIAVSVVGLLTSTGQTAPDKGTSNFSTTIFLAIAYGSSIGGIATLVGSPPNAAMAGILRENHGITVSFFDWFKIGFPFAVALLLLAYFLLVKVIYPNRLGTFPLGSDMIRKERDDLGRWSRPEKITFVVFACTAILWITQEWIAGWLKTVEISDVTIAMIAGISLFLIPAQKGASAPVLEWSDTTRLPWGILIMFGGGLSLAKGFKQSGLVNSITTFIQGLDTGDLFQFVVILCFTGLLLTALMSNLAMVNIFVPVVAALALAFGKDPQWFAIPVTIAASCDFMFPMSTPPNAIAYSSGQVSARQMLAAGIVVNFVAFLLLAALVRMLF